ncbi:IclR family transcriptional regulator [Halobacteriales archaeon QS_4_62_28]|nr:MAG: IclR family transcriptional regulator [Halobacteriales archaeon QS_4_62_28]
MSDTTTPGRKINATENTFDFIEYLHDNGEATLGELTEEMGLSKGTVHTYLATMKNSGYLIQDGNKYRLGLQFLELGEGVRNGIDIIDIVRGSLREIIDKVGGISWFIVEEGGHAVFVEKATGKDSVQPYGHVGRRTTLHDIAGGKAILAHLPESRIDEIIAERGLVRKTDQTITREAELREELAEIREKRYAINDGENLEGWRAVASPIIHEGEVLGSVAVSGPKHRMDGKRFSETVPDLVTAATDEIQLKILSK